MKVAIGNDHAGTELKHILTKFLEDKGHEVINYGTDATDKSEYPIYGEKVARAIMAGEADCGVVICGTGIGISLAANKVKGIRCAVCGDPFSAKMAKQHNNAQMIAIGARVVGREVAKMIVEEWIDNEFLGGRHQERVDMIMNIEENN